jgi:hypothetical protein
MSIVQVEFSDEEERKIGIVKAQLGLSSKAEAVKKIVQLHKLDVKEINNQ